MTAPEAPALLPFQVPLTDAIRRRRLVEIGYGAGLRVVEPHLLGVDAHGAALLVAFQRAGASATARAPAWRTFRLERARFLRVLEDGFAPRRDFDPGRGAPATVLARV